MAEAKSIDIPHGQMALLVVLLLHANLVVTRERLIEELWPEADPKAANNRLKYRVSKLRSALRPTGTQGIVVTRGPGYEVRVDEDAVDVHVFERLLLEATESIEKDPDRTLDLIERALGLWRGDPLADFEYDDFAQSEVRRLHEARLRALELKFEAGLALGRGPELVGEVEAFVQDQPLREKAHGYLMLSLYQAGRQTEALRVYEQARSVLADTAGLDPIPQLTELQYQILEHDPALAAAVSEAEPRVQDPIERAPLEHDPRLSSYSTSFVGRATERQELGKLLSSRPVVTIVGPGGCGKTRLATEVARSFGRDEQVRTRFVDLARVARGEPIEALVAEELDLEETSGDPRRAVRRELASEPQLIVLDNCEHVVESAARFVSDLADLTTLRVLATSREPLRIGGEVLFRIQGLRVSGSREVSEAAQLFIERAADSAPSWVANTADRDVIEAICAKVDGIPLAIELAAARMRQMSPAVIADRLSDRFALLDGGSRTVRARHQTLRAALDWGYDLLDQVERAVFCRLSVFRGSFAPESAAVVCADSELSPALVQSTVWDLVDRSLVSQASATAGERLRLLESVSVYASEMLDEADLAPLQQRFQDWVRDYVDGEGEELRRGDATAAMKRLDSEIDNILHAARIAINNGDGELAMWMGAWLEDYIISRDVLETTALRLMEDALEVDRDVDPEIRANAGVTAGFLAFSRGEYNRAVKLEEAAIGDAERAQAPRSAANACINLGTVKLHQGDLEGARDAFRSAIGFGSVVDDPVWHARNMVVRASVEARSEQSALFAEAAQVIEATGSPLLRAYLAIQHGWLLYGLGRLDDSRETLLQAAALYRSETGGDAALAEVNWALAAVARASGRYDEARQAGLEALLVADTIGWRAGEAIAHLGLGDIAEDADEAARHLEEAEAALRDEPRRPFDARLALSQALLRLEHGEEEIAGGLALDSAGIFRDSNHAQGEAYARAVRAASLLKTSPVEAEAEAVAAAQALANDPDHPIILDGLRCPDVGGLPAELWVDWQLARCRGDDQVLVAAITGAAAACGIAGPWETATRGPLADVGDQGIAVAELRKAVLAVE